MNIDYNDKRFTEVENDKKEAINELDKTYGEMISNSDSYFQELIDASKEYADTQKDIQNENTDFTIEQINQQKEQARQDYIKEQSGSYVDWQKQSNQYGAKAEQMASAGLAGTGYSESSQVSMYNTYQARITAARESYNRAVLNYDNAIKEARLQNNAALAEIAYNALMQQLELSLQGFQYKNTLILEKASEKRKIESEYYTRYQDVLKQINTEIAFDEQVRQYNETLAFQKAQANKSSSSGGSSSISKGSSSSGSSSGSHTSSVRTGVTISGKKTGGLTSATKQAATKELNSMKGITYDKAQAFMKDYGLSDGGVSLLSSSVWSKAKRTGEQGSEFEYSSYSDYAYNYLNWRLQNS